jgi:FKBP-type peptidyl-prolyl cis-trans isomerase 2
MRKSKTVFLLLVGIVLVLVSGCISTDSTAEVVKGGDYVLVDYTGKLEDGTVFDTSIKDVVIDFNHELAGKTLIFDLTLVSISKAE